MSAGTGKGEEAAAILREIRAFRPLVHCITNYVTVNDCANALLAVGARAVMSHAPEEAAEVTGGADALVLNLGGTEYMDAMFLSGQAARQKGIPLVLDPVGAGGSSYRRMQAARLLRECQVSTVRGNAAELCALATGQAGVAGVDSALPGAEDTDGKALEKLLSGLSKEQNCTAIASGAVDRVTDGKQLYRIGGGSPYMTRVTGTGCMASALLGAFLAGGRHLGCPDVLSAAAGMAYMALAGAHAAEELERQGRRGTGSYHIFLMDALSVITDGELRAFVEM